MPEKKSIKIFFPYGYNIDRTEYSSFIICRPVDPTRSVSRGYKNYAVNDESC